MSSVGIPFFVMVTLASWRTGFLRLQSAVLLYFHKHTLKRSLFSNVASDPLIRSSSSLWVQMNILRAVLFSTFLRAMEVSEFPRYPLLPMPAALEEPCQETSGTVFSTKGNKYASGGDAHLLQSGPLKGFKFQTLPSNREQLDFW